MIYVVIDNDDLWGFSIKTQSWERLILYSQLPQIETNVKGGSLCSRNFLWFFKG
jgi:hypothetical protein